jgi:hypothetical protein
MTTDCGFPECREDVIADTGMCATHDHTTVTGSWVKDRHDATSGGEH